MGATAWQAEAAVLAGAGSSGSSPVVFCQPMGRVGATRAWRARQQHSQGAALHAV